MFVFCECVVSCIIKLRIGSSLRACSPAKLSKLLVLVASTDCRLPHEVQLCLSVVQSSSDVNSDTITFDLVFGWCSQHSAAQHSRYSERLEIFLATAVSYHDIQTCLFHVQLSYIYNLYIYIIIHN